MPWRTHRAGTRVTLLDVARHAGVSPRQAHHPSVGQPGQARARAGLGRGAAGRAHLAGRFLSNAGTARLGVPSRDNRKYSAETSPAVTTDDHTMGRAMRR